MGMLFCDWSVRTVGLKELWTLKWHKTFNVNGPYTKAGGMIGRPVAGVDEKLQRLLKVDPPGGRAAAG